MRSYCDCEPPPPSSTTHSWSSLTTRRTTLQLPYIHTYLRCLPPSDRNRCPSLDDLVDENRVKSIEVERSWNRLIPSKGSTSSWSFFFFRDLTDRGHLLGSVALSSFVVCLSGQLAFAFQLAHLVSLSAPLAYVVSKCVRTRCAPVLVCVRACACVCVCVCVCQCEHHNLWRCAWSLHRLLVEVGPCTH